MVGNAFNLGNTGASGGAPDVDDAFRLQIRKLLRLPVPVPALQVRKIAHVIYGWQPISNPMETVREFEKLFQKVAVVLRDERVSPEDDDNIYKVKLLMEAVGLMVASKLEFHRPTDRYLEKLIGPRRDRNVLSGIQSFFNNYGFSHVAAGMLQRTMPSDEEAHAILTTLGWNEPKSAQAHVFSELVRLREYGVKPCIFNDGMLQRVDDAWAFVDGYDLFQRAGNQEIVEWDSPLVVMIQVAKADAAETLRILKHESGALSMIETLFSFVCGITDEGDFVSDIGIGALSIDAYFKRADRMVALELFKLVHLFRLYSLVVPVYKTGKLQVPDWPLEVEGVDDSEPRSKKLAGELRRLILPRWRILQDAAAMQRVRTGLEREKRELALHDVVGHTRHIPGKKPSQLQRELALKHGIELPSVGVTYVKKHDRGTREDGSAGHEVK